MTEITPTPTSDDAPNTLYKITFSANDEKEEKIPERIAGTNSIPKTFITFLKSFLGIGLITLPKGFENGGWLFSIIATIIMGIITLKGFLLLLECRLKCGGTFAELAKLTYGKIGLAFVSVSLILTQAGFSTGYIVFIAKNLHSIILNYDVDVNTIYIGIGCFVLFTLLCWVRDTTKFSYFHLTACFIVVATIIILMIYAGREIAENGVGPNVEALNNQKFMIFIGIGIFIFEGVGMIIPCHEHMKKKEAYPTVLLFVTITVCCVCIIEGLVNYLAYGSSTENIITLNLPQDAIIVEVIEIVYMINLIPTFVLQIYPAMRIIEDTKYFDTMKKGIKKTMTINIERTLIVAIIVVIGIESADKFDKAMSIIGSVCCVPLSYIYPPLFHFKLIARTKSSKVGDIMMIIFGFGSLIFTTLMTIVNWNS